MNPLAAMWRIAAKGVENHEFEDTETAGHVTQDAQCYRHDINRNEGKEANSH